MATDVSTVDGGDRVICAGGYAAPTQRETIDFASITTQGNFTDFGDLT